MEYWGLLLPTPIVSTKLFRASGTFVPNKPPNQGLDVSTSMELFIVQGQIKPVATSMALCTADIRADISMAAFTAQNKGAVVITSTVLCTAHPWVNPADTSTAQSTVVQTALT